VQWRKLLSNPESKTAVIKFFAARKPGEASRKAAFCNMWRGYCPKNKDVKVVVELKCSYGEADTRMLLHATHASQNGYKTTVIVSEDTDVMVLCLGNCKKINCTMYLKCGSQNRTRYINISTIAELHGDDLCDALVGLHAFTGCDSVSASAGRGKLCAFKLVKGNRTYQEGFKSLETSWDISEHLHRAMESFLCQMYAPSSDICDVNDLRYLTKRGEMESSLLLPCRDRLQLHTQRANYQAAVWRQCLEGQPGIPDPKGYRWKTDDKGML